MESFNLYEKPELYVSTEVVRSVVDEPTYEIGEHNQEGQGHSMIEMSTKSLDNSGKDSAKEEKKTNN